MPKQPIDYSKTIIYKICCKDINISDIYIGHTTDYIRRKAQHKFSCNNPTDKSYNFYVYQYIRNNGGWENWDIVEIEKYNCNDKLEASKRERHWVEELKATLNKYIPSRTDKEYKNYMVQYRENNKAKISEYSKIKCFCGICNCNYTKSHKAQHEKSNKHQNNLNKLN